MTNSIYITSAEGNSGKSAIALGLIETLKRAGRRVGIFRPVTRAGTEPDYILELLLTHLGQPDTAGIAVGVSYDDVQTDPEGAMATIVARFNAAATAHDAMVIVGSDYTDVSTPTEFGYNARIAANLGAPVLLVVGGRSPREADRAGAQVFTGLARGPESLFHAAEIALAELNEAHAVPLAVIANRVDPADLANARLALERAVGPERSIPVWVIPEDTVLVAPTLRAIADALDGQLVRGDDALLDREVLDIVVSAMSMEHVLTRLVEDAAVVVPGDRPEVLLAVLMAHQAGTFPNLAGIIVNGGFPVSPIIERLIAGLDGDLPVIETEHTTFETVLRITRTRGKLASESQRKRDLALSLFDRYVDGEQLMQVLDLAVDDVVTPLMFEYRLLEQAALSPKRIVLPEGDDERILRAASTLLQREAAELTILGNEQDVRDKAVRLGIDLSKATVLSPFDPALRDRLAQRYAEMRAHKGITLEAARDIVTDVSYFGTMMVLLGLADGMVSGATHTTAHTIRPAFEVIKTRPGVSIVSSVFLMCLEDRVLVYGDCAVNPNPTAEQLADIAISSSQTARQFGIEPRVAMLSYSTGSSGTGGDVDKVREATAIVRERAPELLVEGPIQYDAAADATVARAKLPDSLVAGQATVFIFPDLNTGNNTYKAVQRSSGAVAIGPVLQGLRKPINDLSRGALVKDIVNTVAITVIQAQAAGESA